MSDLQAYLDSKVLSLYETIVASALLENWPNCGLKSQKSTKARDLF